MNWLYLAELDEKLLARFRASLAPDLELEARPESELPEILGTAERVNGLITGLPPRDLLATAGNLRYLVIPYAGLPRRTREILTEFPALTVINSHYNSRYAAEHAWALLLAAAKRIVPASEKLGVGDWRMRYEGPLSVSLAGKTLLLVGYGAIGRALAPMARAFGMKVKAIKRRAGEAPELDYLGLPADLPKLLPAADAVIVSLPDTGIGGSVIGAPEFSRMRRGVLFVNVGRGAAVDEDAFFDALRAGKIGAAGIDTWWSYPADEPSRGSTAPSRHDLTGFENLVLSPHRASHCQGREEARVDALVEILNAIAAERPINVVDREAGY